MTAVMERMIADRKPLYVALVDMRAAFDTVWRDGLWYKLETMGVPHKLVRIFQEIYFHGRFRVVANGQEGRDVDAVTAGVLQGDVLSPDLFKAFINDLPQFMATAGCSGVEISDTERLMLLLFADDILLWGNTQEELQLQLDTLRQYCQLWQLEVNAAKTKVLLSPHAKLDTPLLYDGMELEVVESSPYLGVLVKGSADWDSMIEKTVAKALKRQSALASILTNRQLPMVVRYTIWATVVRPILEWGTEVYTPPDVSVFEHVQRGALRMIMGVQKHTPVAVLEGDLAAMSVQMRMDFRKSALFGKLKMAPSDSLLGQVREQLHSQKSIRGKKCLGDELERLTAEVLRPAGLTSMKQPEDGKPDPFKEWKKDVRAALRIAERERRDSAARKLSSLAHLFENGTDFTTPVAHPYTLSTNGSAASLWCKVRSNTLPLGRLAAKMKKGVSDKCTGCGGSTRETLMHFLCDCPALAQVRMTWVHSIKEYHPECKITVADIEKLVLGPGSALRILPFEKDPEAVACVERLLVQLWRTRNALHHGSRDASHAGEPARSFPMQPLASTGVWTRDHTTNGEAMIMSSDSHSLNANNSNSTANGPLTRARARMLLQRRYHANEGHPSNHAQGITSQNSQIAQNKSTGATQPPAPRVLRSWPRQLESMGSFPKT